MQLQVFSKMGTLSLTVCGFNNYIFEQKPFLKNIILDSITFLFYYHYQFDFFKIVLKHHKIVKFSKKKHNKFLIFTLQFFLIVQNLSF